MNMLMKKFYWCFLLLPLMLSASCTMMVKTIAKSAAKGYDDHVDLQINQLKVVDTLGKTASFEQLYAGKTVYLYVWKSPILLPPDDKDSLYKGLKDRFAKYDDVVFINIYTGNKEEDWKLIHGLQQKDVKAFRLAEDPDNTAFRDLYSISTSPQIVSKDGHVLGFKGPLPSDKLVVDYALYQARNGMDATASTKILIKGVNKEERLSTEELKSWYSAHFGKDPNEKINASISNKGSDN